MEAHTPTTQGKTLADLARMGRASLAQAGIEHAKQETAWILESVLGCQPLALLVDGEREVRSKEWDEVLAVLARRARREPLQYLLGFQEFCGLDFTVDPAVFIPRPETELVVEELVRRCRSASRPVLADIGTGSGCIAVSLAAALPDALVWATDVSPEALMIARENARRHGVADRVRFLEGDLWDPIHEAGLAGSLTGVASNPPYISDREFPELQPEVRGFEPHRALAGGVDGLAVYRPLIGAAGGFLQPGGWLVLEAGAGQARALTQIGVDSGLYDEIQTRPDAAGIERVVCLHRRPGREG